MKQYFFSNMGGPADDFIDCSPTPSADDIQHYKDDISCPMLNGQEMNCTPSTKLNYKKERLAPNT